jgi:hypothetical protein
MTRTIDNYKPEPDCAVYSASPNSDMYRTVLSAPQRTVCSAVRYTDSSGQVPTRRKVQAREKVLRYNAPQ